MNCLRNRSTGSGCKLGLGALLLLLPLLTGGCVRKRLQITSQPSGAQVMLNGRSAGNTPLTLKFIHHGIYRIELRKPGYLPILDGLRIRRKLYEYIPLDILFDVAWPGTIRDQRKAHYKLRKIPHFNAKEILARARRAAKAAEKAIPELFKAPPGTKTKTLGDRLKSSSKPKPTAKTKKPKTTPTPKPQP
jgi:PEGA domain